MPSISGPTAVPPWTLAPMPFSARGRAVKMTGQTHISDNAVTTAFPSPNPYPLLEITEDLPPPFWRPTPPIWKEERK